MYRFSTQLATVAIDAEELKAKFTIDRHTVIIDFAKLCTVDECKKLCENPEQDFMNFLHDCSVDHLILTITSTNGIMIEYKDLKIHVGSPKYYRGPEMFKLKDYTPVREYVRHRSTDYHIINAANEFLAEIFVEWDNRRKNDFLIEYA